MKHFSIFSHASEYDITNFTLSLSLSFGFWFHFVYICITLFVRLVLPSSAMGQKLQRERERHKEERRTDFISILSLFILQSIFRVFLFCLCSIFVYLVLRCSIEREVTERERKAKREIQKRIDKQIERV